MLSFHFNEMIYLADIFPEQYLKQVKIAEQPNARKLIIVAILSNNAVAEKQKKKR